ncbi:MAG: cytochrome P450 [Planktomarina sp.]
MYRLTQSVTEGAFVQNPYPTYDLARAQGDLVWWDAYDMPAAMSHRAVRMLLTDRRLGRATPQNMEPIPQPHLPTWEAVEAHSMLELEPPTHTRLRGLVLRAFTGRMVNALAPSIETLSHRLIDQFPDEPFDLLKHFAQPLPVTVIANLLGVPTTRIDDLLKWSNTMVAMYQPARTRAVEDAAEAATKDFITYLDDIINHRRKHPGTDLITDLIAAEEAGETLNAAELTSTIILLLNAGHEATVHTIGNAVKTLADHPADITPQTLEELLRFDPPLHIFTRWTYEDIDCFGTTIPKNTQVACVLAAANRDPAAFDNPNQFDPHRKPNKHKSFGAGIHFCVGAPLARLEIEIGLRTLFQRCPNLKITEPPHYAKTYHFHGLTQLMV